MTPNDKARARFEELTWRDLAARSKAALAAQGKDDHALSGEPLSAQEWAEVLAHGAALARHYRHPSYVHHALRAGLAWDDVAEALGTDALTARAAYREWAAGQRRLRATGGPDSTVGMTAGEYAEALALADAVDDDPGAAEDARAAALRELAAVGEDRARLDARARRVVLAAYAAGVPVRQAAEAAGIAPDAAARWVEEQP